MVTEKTRPRRKILMLIPQLGYAGAETSFVRLSNFLAHYHDVTIALFTRYYGTGGYTEGGLEPDSPIVLLDQTEGSISRFKRWFSRWRKFRALKRENDVAISFLSGPNWLNAIAFAKTPIVVSERGSKRHDVAISRLNRWITRIFDPLTYRLADRVVSVSWGLSSEIAQTLGQSSSGKIVTIEGYTDSEKIVSTADQSIEPELERLAGTPLIVACGRLYKQKGFQYLIPIFSGVKTAVGNAKLLIVGDGPDLAELMNLCKTAGLKGTTWISEAETADVIFLGYRENPNRYFRLGRLFVLSSLFEGLPNILIEALASGVACMASDCPWGSRSVLSRNPETSNIDAPPVKLDYGILMPKIEQGANADIWVSHIISVLQAGTQQRATLTQRIERVQRFDMKVTGVKWLDLIDELSADKALSKSIYELTPGGE